MLWTNLSGDTLVAFGQDTYARMVVEVIRERRRAGPRSSYYEQGTHYGTTLYVLYLHSSEDNVAGLVKLHDIALNKHEVVDLAPDLGEVHEDAGARCPLRPVRRRGTVPSSSPTRPGSFCRCSWR